MPVNEHAMLTIRRALSGPYLLLTFRHRETARAAAPGQFVMIKAGTSSEPPLRRPFSIMTTDPEGHTFTLFLKAIGEGTRALSEMEIGAVAQCLGPLGRPFSAPPIDNEALLVAGGYGIAPFLFFAERLKTQGISSHVFYGGRTASDLQLQEPFAKSKIPLTLATDDGSAGERGRVTQALEHYLDTMSGPASLYACGPNAMLHAVAQVGERRGLPVQVSLDPWMGCGVGTCLSCVVPIQQSDESRPKLRCACTAGPVFDSRVVVWPGETESCARRAHAVRA